MINEQVEDLPSEALPVVEMGDVHVLMFNDTIVEAFIGTDKSARQRLRDLREEHYAYWQKLCPQTRKAYENRYIWHRDTPKLKKEKD